MSRIRKLPKIARVLAGLRVPGLRLLGLTLLGLTLAEVAGAQIPEYLGETELPPITHDNAQLTLDNGFGYRGGDYGGQHQACAAPSRAFLELTDPAGRGGWHRVRQHPVDQGSQTGGSCDDPAGQPLFEDFTVFSSDHILSSTVRDTAVDAQTGEVYTLLDLLVAWMIDPEPGLAFARGLAILHWDVGGQLLSQRYLGRLPQGAPPVGIDCMAICDLLGGGGGTGDDYRGRRIELDPTGITIAGSFHPDCQPPTPRSPREVLAARYSRDLSIEHWLIASSHAGEGEGLVLGSGELGQTLVAGFVRTGSDRDDRDIAVLRIGAGGQIERFLTFGGAKDDEPESLVVGTDGVITVQGFFTDQMTVGVQTLGGEGQGLQAFGVELDQDLQPISAWVIEPPNPSLPERAEGLKQPGINRMPEPLDDTFSTAFTKSEGAGEDEAHFGILEQYLVVHGQEVRGELDQLIDADNDYMRIVDRTGEYIELRGFFDPDPMHRQALYLKEVGWELKTEFCYRAQVLLRKRRLDQPDPESEIAVMAGERRMCPSNARGRVQVTPELSVALGYDGTTEVDLTEWLEVIFLFMFEDGEPQPMGGAPFKDASEGAKDASVDHVEVEIEY